jgi:hypothetical protein
MEKHIGECERERDAGHWFAFGNLKKQWPIKSLSSSTTSRASMQISKIYQI